MRVNQKLNSWIALCVVFLATPSHANDNGLMALDATKCSRILSYNIFLSGLRIGDMEKTEIWQGKSAVVNTSSRASILGIGTRYQQQAHLYWSTETHEWLTETFHQKVSGFRARDMKVSFTDNGHTSYVKINGHTTRYQSGAIPSRDLDTLSIQIRENVLQGYQQFELNRQATNMIEPYQFEVQDLQSIRTENWGELMVIPVKQTGAETITYYFAPSIDYQLIQARYHGFMLKGYFELDHYTSTCELVI